MEKKVNSDDIPKSIIEIKPISLKLTTQISSLILSLLYGSGVIVYSHYLSSYNIYALDLIIIRYLTIGFQANLFLLTYVFCFMMMIYVLIKYIKGPKASLGRTIYHIVLFVFATIACIASLLAIGGTISIRLVIYFLLFCGVIYLIYFGKPILIKTDNKRVAKLNRLSVHLLLFMVYIGYLTSYANCILPAHNMFFGSLARNHVVLSLNIKDDIQKKSFPLEFSDTTFNQSIPYKLIYEDDKYCYLLIEKNSRRSLKISKDIISYIIILDEKDIEVDKPEKMRPKINEEIKTDSSIYKSSLDSLFRGNDIGGDFWGDVMMRLRVMPVEA